VEGTRRVLLDHVDWPLLIVAILAVVWGVVANQPLPNLESRMAYPWADWRFPWELVTGLALAGAALFAVIVRAVVRLHRKSSANL
jgi:hypothetical protein